MIDGYNISQWALICHLHVLNNLILIQLSEVEIAIISTAFFKWATEASSNQETELKIT